MMKQNMKLYKESESEMLKEPCVSIILPAHNEAMGLGHTVESIESVVADCSEKYELILVDDGSQDDTYEVIRCLAVDNPRIRGIKLSRNFGKEAALLAGLESAGGDVVITMDSDLQHPPELIPELIKHWRQGFKVVNAVKQDRTADRALTRLRATIFNRLLTLMSGVEMSDSSDYKLLDRRVVDVLVHQLPEHRRFFRGLSSWLGFAQADVPFTVAERSSGRSKWSMLELTGMATTAIISFSSAPLRLVTVIGLLTFGFGTIVAIDAVWTWFHGRAVSGFATTIITLLIVSA
jgi:glycosyltransferase involved in cell wall biosynthesis